jgi:phosphonate transport system substrate-binding protein
MYVRADSGITSLEQMRGRTMAWADPNSASGYLIPRAAMRAQGINPESFFGRSGFAGGHEQAIVAVLGRQFDAGVTWASGVGDPAEGFSRGMLRADGGQGHAEHARHPHHLALRPDPERAAGGAQGHAGRVQGGHDRLPPRPADRSAGDPPAVERGTTIGWVPTRHEDYELFVQMRREEAEQRRRRN